MSGPTGGRFTIVGRQRSRYGWQPAVIEGDFASLKEACDFVSAAGVSRIESVTIEREESYEIDLAEEGDA